MASNKTVDIGVVIGRFQVPELHAGHLAVIQKAHEEARNILIFIGVAPALGATYSPLDYSTRAKMVQEQFPEAIVLPLLDRPTNTEWSKHLDLMIRSTFPIGTVMLYGGRDAFIPQYKGRYNVVEIEGVTDESGTEVRKDAGKIVRNSPDFRAGIIYSSHNQYPRVHMTVDIAVIKGHEVLMGRRTPKDSLRFPGGFVDPSDKSLAEAAVRELHEEVNLDEVGGIDSYQYVDSFLVDDWRYKREERIITALFKVKYGWGIVSAKDELDSVEFIKLSKDNLDLIVDSHKPLFKALLKGAKRGNRKN